MKKIISIFALLFTALLLVGCYESTGEIHEVIFYIVNEVHEVQEVIDGDKAQFVEPAILEGLEFKYWQLNGKEYTFNSRVTKSIDLDAKYEPKTVVDQTGGALNVFYINDTHGAVLNTNDEMGLSKIGNLIIDEFTNKPEETIFIAGGDIFQGQIISNDNRGAIMIELFNEMKLDALVLGNHEFDWGIGEILKYFDPNTSGVKANFPVLGANIFKKSNNEMLDFVDPYTIIERNNIKIGIIGTMGQGLESSIMLPRVEDYYFADPLPIIEKYTKELREEKNVDIVIVVNHGDNTWLETSVGNLGGSSKVDLYFKAHTHQVQSGHNQGMPFLQAGNNGRYLGQASLNYEIIDNKLKSDRTKTLLRHLTSRDEARLNKSNANLDVIVNRYIESMASILNDEVIIAGSKMDSYDLSGFIVRVIKNYTNADVALHNGGGTRAGFDNNQSITAADVFKVFPFDNRIVLVSVKGSELNKIKSSYYISSESSNFINNETYLVAVNDYSYFGNQNSFGNNNYEFYEFDLYELLLKVLKDLRSSGVTKFYLDSNLPQFK